MQRIKSNCIHSCGMVRPLPTGIQDFKELRRGGYLYVDKTDMISQILVQKAKAYLYLRPRRFGKFLNLSMLDAFFNIEYKDDDSCFDGLKVSSHKECDIHRNAYPVIFFDFKELSVDDKETFENQLALAISELYRKHKYILQSEVIDDDDKEFFRNVIR